MAGEKKPVSETISNLFAGLNPRNQGPLPTVSDIGQSFTNGMSQREMDAYDAYLQNNSPSTGQLPVSAYYPDAGNAIGVGNYSGRVIGSQTTYAPGGGLVPLGMIDARRKALEDSAINQSRSVDAFRNQFKAPTSDLVNINEGLTDQYFSHLDTSWKKALQQSKGNPNQAVQILRNDPEFWKTEKSYHDAAKMGNVTAKSLAEIQTRLKKGDLVSPAERNSMSEILKVSDPSSPEFKNYSLAVRRLQADNEFTKTAGEMLKAYTENETGRTLDLSNADDYKIYKEHLASLTPDAKKSIEDNLLNIYEGSDIYSKDYIKKNAAALTDYVKVKKELSVHAKPKPDENDNYTEDDISQEPSSTNVFVNRGKSRNKAGEEVLNVRNGVISGNYGVTHKKPIPAIIPNGAHVYINDDQNGLIASKEIDQNSDTKLFKTELVRASKTLGVPLTDGQIESGMDYKWVPMTRGIVTSKDEDGNEIEKEIFVPTKEVENSLVKSRGKDGKVVKGIPVDKIYDEADKRNKEKSPQSKKTDAVKTKKDPLGLGI